MWRFWVVFQRIIARIQDIIITRYFIGDVLHILLLPIYTVVSVISIQFQAMGFPIITVI